MRYQAITILWVHISLQIADWWDESTMALSWEGWWHHLPPISPGFLFPSQFDCDPHNGRDGCLEMVLPSNSQDNGVSYGWYNVKHLGWACFWMANSVPLANVLPSCVQFMVTLYMTSKGSYVNFVIGLNGGGKGSTMVEISKRTSKSLQL